MKYHNAMNKLKYYDVNIGELIKLAIHIPIANKTQVCETNGYKILSL